MLTTARPGSLLWALARPPLLEPPRHPHERLSHMTEISHFKRPRRAGRGARQGRRPLAGGEPHHVAARGAGGKAGAEGGAGPHRLTSGFPHVAAHGAGCARKDGGGRRGGWGSGGGARWGRSVVCYLRLQRGGAGTTPGTLQECRRLRSSSCTHDKEMLRAPLAADRPRHPLGGRRAEPRPQQT